jgi:hypothetical protein
MGGRRSRSAGARVVDGDGLGRHAATAPRPTMPAAFPSGLLALSDGQLEIIMLHAHPLRADARGAFLEAVSAKLAGVEPGDGVVSRACRELQRDYFQPDAAVGSAGKWERDARQRADSAQRRFAAALPKDG